MTVLVALPLASRSAPLKASTNAAPQQSSQSTFVMPKSPAQGRDPFYPNATSLYQTEVAPTRVKPDTGLSSLKLNGILGSDLAQINNVTLQVGETEEIKTPTGTVAVHLLEIHAAAETVVIEVSGQRRTLAFHH